MKIVQKFPITSVISLQILVPEVQDKFNYYYEPTDALHKFDECSVILILHGESYTVITEIIQDIVCSLCFYLKNALKNKIILPPQIALGSLTAVYNRDYYRSYWLEEGLPGKEIIDYHQFWLWSTPNNMQSWIYNRDDAIYLEIGKTYIIPEDQEQPNDADFQNYMAHYKPLLCTKISHKIAHDWLEKCKKIILEIDSEYELTV
jgi:hypothetical protein